MKTFKNYLGEDTPGISHYVNINADSVKEFIRVFEAEPFRAKFHTPVSSYTSAIYISRDLEYIDAKKFRLHRWIGAMVNTISVTAFKPILEIGLEPAEYTADMPRTYNAIKHYISQLSPTETEPRMRLCFQVKPYTEQHYTGKYNATIDNPSGSPILVSDYHEVLTKYVIKGFVETSKFDYQIYNTYVDTEGSEAIKTLAVADLFKIDRITKLKLLERFGLLHTVDRITSQELVDLI